ncbi:MAG: NAD(P)/FAD-dependent oxidoreductase, partial [Flavobacteriales bacterium]|nr:NAD(P)/FAD-dependent oxidoreductase [Flavobacteriales bacterium]
LLQKLRSIEPPAYAKALNFGRPELALIKAFTTKAEFLDTQRFTERIKDLQLPVTGLRPIDEAISTAGGISTKALDPHFRSVQHPHLSFIGEMVDWDAPTGGFLLQGCFAMGHHAAGVLLDR